MSRSNLLRKVKKITKLSVSRLIRRERLIVASELLKRGSLNVTEVSFEVGFGSVSYFIRCFHEYFGVSPGEAGKSELYAGESSPVKSGPWPVRKTLVWMIPLLLVLLVVVIVSIFMPFNHKGGAGEGY